MFILRVTLSVLILFCVSVITILSINFRSCVSRVKAVFLCSFCLPFFNCMTISLELLTYTSFPEVLFWLRHCDLCFSQPKPPVKTIRKLSTVAPDIFWTMACSWCQCLSYKPWQSPFLSNPKITSNHFFLCCILSLFEPRTPLKIPKHLNTPLHTQLLCLFWLSLYVLLTCYAAVATVTKWS